MPKPIRKFISYITPSQSKLAIRPLSTARQPRTPGSYNTLDWQDHCHNHDSLANFNIVTFNLLAPCYKRLSSVSLISGHREREANYRDLWRDREQKTLEFLKDIVFPTTSVIAFQEYWLDEEYSSSFADTLRLYGYELTTLQRTGMKMDAVALAIKSSTFTIMGGENITLYSAGDRVALLLWLKHNHTGKDFLIANTHLSFPHSSYDRINQMRQMRKLTSVIDAFALDNCINHATRVILGDFNVQGESPVCDHLRSEGYVSCAEISPPNNIETATTRSILRQESLSYNTNQNVSCVQDFKICKLSSRPSDSHISSDESELIVPMKDSPITRYPVKFVSHRTHRSEDLGVDHIFVKPELEYKRQFASDTLSKGAEARSRRTDSNHNKTTIESVHIGVHNSSVDITVSYDVSTATDPKRQLNHHHSNLGENIECVGGIFVDGTEVIPNSKPSSHWETSFTISDHRPIGACLVIGRKMEEEQLH